MPHRIVIVGGGFGGLNAVKELGNSGAHVTLIDRKNYHLFQPLLYQVATGSLSPGDICAPLRPQVRRHKNTGVLLAEVVDFDLENRRVILSDGEVPYDTLVVASGSEPSYFGHNEWRAGAPPLKDVEDATDIRRRLLIAFEAAEREPDAEARSVWLTFVIVGAGPTGVEMAGALGEIANDTLRGDFRSIDPREARIFLIEGAGRVLPGYPPDLSNRAEQDLIELGVRTMTDHRVTSLDAGGVTLSGPGGKTQRIATRTVVWAAGVRSSPLGRILSEKTGIALDRAGRLPVEGDLTLRGHSEIFVIGDLARLEHNGEPLPGLAPVAIQQGRYAGRVIRGRLRGRAARRPFRYFDKGTLATIGRGKAVGSIGRLHLKGLLCWLVWLFIHLMYLVGFENRLLVFVQWAFYYFTFNRRARLITGASPLPLRKPIANAAGRNISREGDRDA